jgi:hypothetical protein
MKRFGRGMGERLGFRPATFMHVVECSKKFTDEVLKCSVRTNPLGLLGRIPSARSSTGL